MGRAVEELRREAGLTQEQLADRCHTDFPQIGMLERGASNPTFTSLLRVVRGLDIELSQLIQRFDRIRRRLSED